MIIRGAALLVEAANMGDPDAQYELGCRLRVEVRLYFLFITTYILDVVSNSPGSHLL